MPISTSSALHAAISDIRKAAERPDPLERVKSVLGDHVNRFHAAGELVHEEDDDEVLLHAGHNLTIYHITLSPGLEYPAHNHLMDALIGIYKGGEANFIYPIVAGKLAPPERRDCTAPAVVHLPSNTVHSVANTGAARSGAVHVYLGNLPQTHRQMWRPPSHEAEPFDNERYLSGARPIEQAKSGRR